MWGRGLDKSVRDITDKLDSVGNTTAAIGKGFAIGSAALTALALFVSYAEAVKLTTIDILNAHVIVGLFIGGMLTFLFSAMTMESVSKAAHQMIEEVRRQFREKPGSVPAFFAKVSASETAAIFTATIIWLASFATLPAPNAPTYTTDPAMTFSMS